MNEIIIGNVCSVFAMISDSISGTRKNRAQMLGIQIISQFFYAAGSFILKGYSSVAQNVVAVLRNLAGIKNVKSKAVEWVLILLGVVLLLTWCGYDEATAALASIAMLAPYYLLLWLLRRRISQQLSFYLKS